MPRLKDRLKILYEIDTLLPNCKGCPKNTRFTSESPEIRCRGCETYTRLRELGSMLDGNKSSRARKTDSIKVEDYYEQKKKGLTEKATAQKLGIATSTLRKLKIKWGIKK